MFEKSRAAPHTNGKLRSAPWVVGDAPFATLPVVTVIMPVRNEASYISRSLLAVLRQDYPVDRLEILVVDGMSTDGTDGLIDTFRAEHPSLRLLFNPGKIVSTGLNLALTEARGEVIVRVDGHCEIAPDYIRRCVEHLLRDGVDGVGGPLATVGESGMARVIAAAMRSPFGVGGAAFRTTDNKSMLTDTVAFPAYKREVIERAGPFDAELVRNQDDEYNYRLRKNGAKILLAADVRARYYSRSSLRSLWRQYFQYGFWKVRVLQKHPLQMRPRQFVPPIFVFGLMATSLLAVLPPGGKYLLIPFAGAYAATNLAASLLAIRNHRGRHFFLLPVVFAILHISYGLGFLTGLLRFAKHWRVRRKYDHAK